MVQLLLERGLPGRLILVIQVDFYVLVLVAFCVHFSSPSINSKITLYLKRLHVNLVLHFLGNFIILVLDGQPFHLLVLFEQSTFVSQVDNSIFEAN